MEYFNPQEDVLHIELTQYGKYLLSMGKCRPSHYLFFDAGVLYDANYGGVSTEKQKDVDKRIKDNTPRMKTQYNFSSVDNKFLIGEQATVETSFSLVNPLGTSDLSSNIYPKWSLQVLSAGEPKISGSTEYMTSSFQTLRTPQIEMDVNYRTTVSLEGKPPAIKEDPSLSSKVFADGTYVSVEPRAVLMSIAEKYSAFEKENFDIEVYIKEREENLLISGSAGYVDEWTPLSFKKKKQKIVNGILLDETPEECIEIDKSFVEYYFDIFTDGEIDENIICQAISELKSKDIYVDVGLVCDDITTTTNVYDIYSQVVPDDPCPDDECP